MVDIDKLAHIANAGHADAALVAVPVSLIREIARDLRAGNAARAMLTASRSVGDVCQGLVR